MNKRLAGLEAARGIAALLVVLYHVTRALEGPRDYGSAPMGGLFSKGGTGVDIFFVISGFIIHFIHAGDFGQPARLARFAWRRFSRIYPTYWVAFAFFGAILLFSPTADRAERDPLLILSSLALIPDRNHEPILGVAWTLQYEVLFYALFATAILSRILGGILFAIWATAIGFVAFTGAALGFPLSFVTSPFNAEFLIGVGASIVFARYQSIPFPHALLVCALTGYLGTLIFVPVTPGLHVSVALAAAAGLLGVTQLEKRGLIVSEPLLALGNASYSIYLMHVPCVLLLQAALRLVRPEFPVARNIAFVIIVATTLALCIGFHRIVERPLMRFSRNGFCQKRQRVATTTGTYDL